MRIPRRAAQIGVSVVDYEQYLNQILEAESIWPGIFLGEYDFRCESCGKAYVVHGDELQATPNKCPYCEAEGCV